MRFKSSLYITYDGLLDPLGGSQILPYLRSIATHEEELDVLSFEKSERYSSYGGDLRAELEKTSIKWTPLIFTRSFGVIGKLWDLLRMVIAAWHIASKYNPSIVHARSHAPAQVALLIKWIFKAKLLFDFRGLWVDERIDKGSWTPTNPWHRFQYQILKRIENLLLSNADHLVVLTEAVIPEVLRLGVSNRNVITVIPCCADFQHFQLVTPQTRKQSRDECGINQNSLVLGYVGSVGGMYLTDRFLRLVELAILKQPELEVLALTPDPKAFRNAVIDNLPTSLHKGIKIFSANRNQMARWLTAIDILVAFFKPSYARMGASPTKLAESWAMGIPVVCNQGVGDLQKIMNEIKAGNLIENCSDKQLLEVVESFPILLRKGGNCLRIAAKMRFGLDLAADRYKVIYQGLRKHEAENTCQCIKIKN